MHSLFLPRPDPTVRVAVAAAALVLLLSGCVPAGLDGGTPGETAAPRSTPSSAPTDDATSAPDDGTDETPVGTPIAKSCEQFIGAQAIYDFNPNFGLLGDFTPAGGSPAAIAVAENALACQWINQTSGETIQISVANLPSSRLSQLASTASSGAVVSGVGDEAYFANGTAQVFDGSYWVVAESTAFFGWEDAAPLVEAALANLR